MNCPSCEHTNRSEAKFCDACGTALMLACASCGNELRVGARFCDSCGTSISGQASAPPPAARGNVVPEGERRNVTILFADAVGHTSISEQLGEEVAYDLMQGCFKRMQQAVEHHGGTVNQYTGDGILALFGAPIAYEDSAQRAVMAALEMQELLNSYAAEVHTKHPIQCAYRVGLNTGPVVVGSISSTLDLDYAAVGDTVNLAARMEAMAEPHTVYLTENTYRATRDHFDFECLGPMAVKGKEKPVTIYKVLHEKSAQSRMELATLRGLTPYVGRAQEQSILNSYFNKARDGQGQVVLISGDAGIGKSRTLFEFRQSLPSGVRWLEGQCISFGRNIPYLPIIDVFKRAFDVNESDVETDIVEKVEKGSGDWNESARRTVPYARFLLNVDPGDEAISKLDPLERRAGFFDAFRAVAIEEARKSFLIIVIEDLHWIDDESQEIVKALVDIAATLPILVILTARPGYTHSLGERTYLSRLALDNLPARDGAELAKQALGAAGLPDELQYLIAKKAEGNPFFIEEVIRSLTETGALLQTEDGYALQQDIAEISVPNTINDVILARIDRLNPQAKEAMQLASVIGREFTARLLNRISNLEEQLNESLDELKGLELIYETGYMPELSFMFKHALTHDVAYSTLLHERRKRLHRTVAMAIETLFEDRIADHYEALAHHYDAAQEWDKALDYLMKSGEKAFDACAIPQAIGFYTRAIAICEDHRDIFLEQLVENIEKRARVYEAISDYAHAIEDLNHVVAIAQELGDQHMEGMGLAFRGYVRWADHDFDKCNEDALRAIEIGGNDDDVQFAGHGILLVNHFSVGRNEAAAAYMPAAMSYAETATAPMYKAVWAWALGLVSNWQARYDDALIHINEWRSFTDGYAVQKVGLRWLEGLALGSQGNYRESLAIMEEVLSSADRIGNWMYRIRLLNTIGWVYNEVQDFDKSRRQNEIALQAARDAPIHDVEVENNARLNLAECLMATGDMDRVVEQFDVVEKVVRNPLPEQRMSLHNFSMRLFHDKGEWELHHGNAAAALGLAEQCMKVATETERPKYIVRAHRLRGQVYDSEGNPERAVEEIKRATDLAREIGNRTQLWKSATALGEHYAHIGKTTEARNAFGEANTIIGIIADGLDAPAREIYVGAKEITAIRDASTKSS